MSVWPSTATPCCAQTLSVVSLCTASTSPAWTEVIRWGDLTEWKICRARRDGVRSSACEAARYPSRSRAPHSHSRFCRKAKAGGKVSLLRVVSIWNTLTPALGDEASHPPVGGVQLRAVLVHEGAALLHGQRVVVVAEAPVAGQPGGHALVAAVHGHQVDVDVDEQVALGGPPVDLHVLVLRRSARGGRGRTGPRRRAGSAARSERRRRRSGRRARGGARPRSSAGEGPGPR